VSCPQRVLGRLSTTNSRSHTQLRTTHCLPCTKAKKANRDVGNLASNSTGAENLDNLAAAPPPANALPVTLAEATILQSLPNGVVLLSSSDNTIQYINRVGLCMLGYTSDDDALVVGKHACSILGRQHDTMQWIIQDPRTVPRTAEILRKDGTSVVVMLRVASTDDRRGFTITMDELPHEPTIPEKEKMPPCEKLKKSLLTKCTSH
jgi:PAS domain-containing protein